ncbi:MAG: hypothetical protein SNH88_00155 [Rikenellaceae bacterium]
MPIFLLSFGLISGCALSILVGILGSRRSIGFGWAFIASLLLTPFIGLIITLLSDPLPYPEQSRWGCMGVAFSIVGALLLIPFIMMIVTLLMLI